MPRPSFSDASLTVVVVTLNEAVRLERCLDAIPDRYPVLVLDSGSTDDTLAIAPRRGCVVAHNPWPGFAEQRNVALTRCGIESRWVLFVDCDEFHQPTFFDWFEAEGRERQDFDVAMLTSWLVFRGVTLRHAPGYPIYHPRLVRRGAVHFVPNQSGHGETVAAGTRCLTLDIPYAHHFYDGDLSGWMTKHIGRAAQEAFLLPGPGREESRRARLLRLAGRLPFRPMLRFLYHYLLRGGCRDGRAGLEYALMYMWYEATKSLFRLVAGGRPASRAPAAHAQIVP